MLGWIARGLVARVPKRNRQCAEVRSENVGRTCAVLDVRLHCEGWSNGCLVSRS